MACVTCPKILSCWIRAMLARTSGDELSTEVHGPVNNARRAFPMAIAPGRKVNPHDNISTPIFVNIASCCSQHLISELGEGIFHKRD
jgi:hypothetical protein